MPASKACLPPRRSLASTSRAAGTIPALAGIAAIALIAAIGAIATVSPARGGEFVKVIDIVPGFTGSQFDSYDWTPAHDGRLFLPAQVSGDTEPWMSDGTLPGTDILMDINGSASAGAVRPLAFGQRTCFLADDGFHGGELWCTGGTEATTERISEIGVNAASCQCSTELVVRYGLAYIGAAGGLWSTNGTLAGTTLIGGPGVGSFTLTHADGTLFFSNSTGGFYKSHGGVPTLVADIGAQVSQLTPVRGKLFFVGNDGTDTELWVSDGVSATELDLLPGGLSSTPNLLTAVEHRLFFVAGDTDHGRELWVSDGTLGAGTHLVEDIRPNAAASNPEGLTAFGGKVVFYADDGTSGKELWISDGTEAGTFKLREIVAGNGGLTPGPMVQVGHLLYFAAPRGPSVLSGLWQTDGTTGGTQILDLQHAVPPSEFEADWSGHLWFKAFHGSYGTEPWVIDLVKKDGPRFCARPRLPIPDSGSFFHRLKVPPFEGGETVHGVTVDLDINHTYVNDLVITLSNGNRDIVLANRVDTPATDCSGYDMVMTFDDGAPLPANGNCANADPAFPRHSSWKPAEPLAGFVGDPIGDEWALTIEDLAEQDVGTLNGWCINFLGNTVHKDGFESGTFAGWAAFTPNNYGPF